MEKETLVYGIIAIVIFVVLVIGMSTLFSKEQKALSKTAFECKYLSSIPLLCTEEDKQKLKEDEEKKLQLREQQINAFLEKVISTFKDCGANSKQTCKCSLEFSKLLNTPTIMNVGADGFVHVQNMQTGFNKKVEGVKKIYINDFSNQLIELNSLAGTNSLFFDTKEERILSEYYAKLPVLRVTSGAGKDMFKIVSYYKSSDMDSIAILKQGSNKGIYFKYNKLEQGFIINIPECPTPKPLNINIV